MFHAQLSPLPSQEASRGHLDRLQPGEGEFEELGVMPTLPSGSPPATETATINPLTTAAPRLLATPPWMMLSTKPSLPLTVTASARPPNT